MTKTIFDDILQENMQARRETMSFLSWLDLCKSNPSTYASAAERMLNVIGEPKVVDTSKDSRLSRIFMNRTVRIYPAFKDFYGMEETIERIVGYFRHAAQG
jgi:serine protein kinase